MIDPYWSLIQFPGKDSSHLETTEDLIWHRERYGVCGN